MGGNITLSIFLPLGALILALGVMGLFSRKNQFIVEGRTILLTGGSSGLGLSLAKLLAAKGANVVIVAQDVAKLEASIKEITASAKSPQTQRFHFLSYDLRNPDSAPRILSTVTEWNNNAPPDIVWCCAGNSLPGFFASSSIEHLRGQMDSIYWSAAYVAHAALNLWIGGGEGQKGGDSGSKITTASPAIAKEDKSKTRHLIFTASTLAFFPIAGYAPYSPAKAAMRTLADTLNQEVAVYNGARRHTSSSSSSSSPSSPPPPSADIKIHTLFPMGILTPGYEHENTCKPALTLKFEETETPQQPDELAKITINALERGDKFITSNLLGHLMKGAGMGGSVRTGVMDVLWNALGSVVILFVAPDFVNQCWKWGKEKGMGQAK